MIKNRQWRYRTPQLTPFRKGFGDLIPVQEWLDAVTSGGFIDYDGYGDLATKDGYDECGRIRPSIAFKYKIPSWVTHVWWYNR